MKLWKYGNGKMLTALAVFIFSYFHTSTVAYCGEAATDVKVFPQSIITAKSKGHIAADGFALIIQKEGQHY